MRILQVQESVLVAEADAQVFERRSQLLRLLRSEKLESEKRVIHTQNPKQHPICSDYFYNDCTQQWF